VQTGMSASAGLLQFWHWMGRSMGGYKGEAIRALVVYVFWGWILSRLAKKAGYPRWFGLAMLVPLLNIGLMIWFAFTEWPIETKLARIEAGGPIEEPTAIWRE
jgi:uncharacterized membrane protein YhdT